MKRDELADLRGLIDAAIAEYWYSTNLDGTEADAILDALAKRGLSIVPFVSDEGVRELVARAIRLAPIADSYEGKNCLIQDMRYAVEGLAAESAKLRKDLDEARVEAGLSIVPAKAAYLEEADRSELVVTDEPHIYAETVSVQVVRSVASREIVGFAWSGKEPALLRAKQEQANDD